MRYIWLLSLWLLSLLSTLAADTPAGAPAPATIQAPGWLGLLPLVTPVVIYVLRQIAGRLPSALWPVLAAALPALAEYLVAGRASEFTGVAALLGLSGVGVREVTNQILKSVMPGTPGTPGTTSAAGGPTGTTVTRMSAGPLAFAALLTLALLPACANIEQRASSIRPDGTMDETSIKVSVAGDAKQIVDKLRASNGKTHSLGAQGVSQESSLQGLVELLGAIYKAGFELGASGVKAAASGGLAK